MTHLMSATIPPRHCAPVLGALTLLLAGCTVGEDRPLARCLEQIESATLQLEDYPPQTRASYSHGSSVRSHEFFDAQHHITLDLGVTGDSVFDDLCRRLETHLAERCDVRRTSTGAAHCAFDVNSPDRATTGPSGIHHHRSMRGRVNLFAQPTSDGRTELILTATEWPG